MSVNNSESREELVERIYNDLQECRAMIDDARDQQQKMWRSLAGSSWDRLLQSREATEAFLVHDNPKLRIVALQLLRGYWKAKPDVTTFYERIALADPDPQVRGVALVFLGYCHEKSNDARMGEFFANRLCDQSETENNRFISYVGLYQVRGLPASLWPKKKSFRFPRDVDWSFVNSFLVNRKGTE